MLKMTKKMPEYIKEEYDMDYTVNVSAYKAVADSLKSLAGISNLMVIVSVILGTITLSFLILMNLRDRMFEIGILLSVGETKMRIMLQMLMESFCPVLLAITAGVNFFLSFGECDKKCCRSFERCAGCN